MTRAERIADLNAQIAAANEELEFLNDSGTFYELDLGTGRKTVLIVDFSATDGIKTTSVDNSEKLGAAFYQNYAGFTSDQEASARETFARMRAYLMLQRIHEWLYPSGIDRAATGDDIFKWVISYDPIANDFVPKNVGGNSGVDAPTQYEALFYFKGTPGDADNASADAEQAITLIKNATAGGTDEILRELFGMVSPDPAP